MLNIGNAGKIILLVICLCFVFDVTKAQTENKIGIGLSSEFMGGASLGAIATVTGEINYPISNVFSISGFYRGGSENGMEYFGAVEPSPEGNNYVATYHEISSLFICSKDNSVMRAYFGGGLGVIWGDKVKAESYILMCLPFEAGLQVYVFKGLRMGLQFTGEINEYSTFKGVGINMAFVF